MFLINMLSFQREKGIETSVTFFFFFFSFLHNELISFFNKKKVSKYRMSDLSLDK
jgi:hypothetical protein